MSNVSAAHDFYDGDTHPDAPAVGFTALYFKGGEPFMRRAGEAPISLLPRLVIPLAFFGEAVLNQVFGKFVAAAPLRITTLEIDAQDAPVGAALIVELVDGAGASFTPARTITVAAGGNNARQVLATPLAVAASGALRAKITQVGSSFAGGGLNLRLTSELTTS